VWLTAWLALLSSPPSAPAAERPPGVDLADRERELERQYQELERGFLRLADVLEPSDPRRAALLRGACETARGAQFTERLAAITQLLEQGQLLRAGDGQEAVIEQLRGLLERLAAGEDQRRLVDERARVREYLGRVVRAIARQREIRGATEADLEASELVARQQALADQTAALARDLGEFSTQAADTPAQPTAAEDAAAPGARSGDPPGERSDAADPGAAPGAKPPGAPPDKASPEPGTDAPVGGDDESARATRTGRRLEQAERKMRRARAKLEQARRTESLKDQEEAIEELETARAELQEILRQLREEEVERVLVQLEARVRQMLRTEKSVLGAIRRLVADSRPNSDRGRQIETARISREQAEVAVAATRALLLVRDDGSAVAIPQALEQVRDDAEQVATRVGRGDLASATAGLAEDIVSGLEELLASLERARGDPERARQSGPGGRAPEPGEEPLVDALAELKMLRSLQGRVNQRTISLARLLADGAEEAEEPELRTALAKLAERQRQIERAASDIVGGRTE
jgi:hypothetical protein